MNKKTYKTGEVAKLAGVTIRTLRYYDSVDLLKPSKVLENGHRLYDSADIEKLQLIIGLKLLDFSLVDIKEYLNKPNIDLISILKYQDKMIERKMNLYKNIREKIAFIREHFNEDSYQVKDIFSLYEMMQMINHNEIAKKYFSTDSEVDLQRQIHEQEDNHDNLNKSIMLLAQGAKKLTSENIEFIKKTFSEFICMYFKEVSEDTIGKTTLMIIEMLDSDITYKNIGIDEMNLYNWLTDNLLGGE